MKFVATPLAGAYVIELEPAFDERGFFARTWCRDEFAAHGLNSDLSQCSLSWNKRKGTLRGLHYQHTPYQEAKLVRCCSGSIYDVIVDLRPESPTFKKWFAAELTACNHKMLYVPEGMAHGFQALEDGSTVFYQITEPYRPEYAGGVRWNDPQFHVPWPLPDPILSPRDAAFSDYPS
jgi:dTDP-4-dehydrorhamnose 3,5-epimerase